MYMCMIVNVCNIIAYDFKTIPDVIKHYLIVCCVFLLSEGAGGVQGQVQQAEDRLLRRAHEGPG